MTIVVTGRGCTVSPALRRYVQTKVQRLSKFLPKILDVRVVLAIEKYRHRAEVTLARKGGVIHSAEAASDFRSAVDVVVETISQKARRTKDRIRQRKPRTSQKRRMVRDQGFPSGFPAEAPQGDGPVVVARRRPLKPMSLDEAVMQMGIRREDQFMVFTNARTETVNVLYRRKDGTLGLIEPE